LIELKPVFIFFLASEIFSFLADEASYLFQDDFSLPLFAFASGSFPLAEHISQSLTRVLPHFACPLSLFLSCLLFFLDLPIGQSRFGNGCFSFSLRTPLPHPFFFGFLSLRQTFYRRANSSQTP